MMIILTSPKVTRAKNIFLTNRKRQPTYARVVHAHARGAGRRDGRDGGARDSGGA